MTLVSIQPVPSKPTMDLADRALSYAKALGDSTLRLLASKRSDFTDVGVIQFVGLMLLPAIVCAVYELVGVIAGSRVPAQVPGIDAAILSLAAAMGGLVFIIRSMAMRRLAYDAMDEAGASTGSVDVGVALRQSIVRPYQTVIAFVRDGDLINKSLRIALSCPARQWVRMLLPSPVVRSAKSSRRPRDTRWLKASIYFAGFEHATDSSFQRVCHNSSETKDCPK